MKSVNSIRPWIFWIALFIGSTLRFYALFSKPFWFDESITFYFAKLPIYDLLRASLSDNNPPLYYLLIHFVQKISTNEYILRAPSYVFSIASIFALAFLTQKLSLKNSLFAVSLMALSPLEIYLSSEARLHALATLMALLLTIAFVNLTKRFSLKNSSVFVALSALSLYTHYYLALLFIPFSLIIITKFGKKIGNWLLILPVILILYSPWILFLFSSKHNSCWCPNTIISLPATLASPVINGLGQITQRTFTNLPVPIIFLFTSTCLLFFYAFVKGIPKTNMIPYFYLTPLLLLTASGLFIPVFSPKGFSIFAPFYFAVVASGKGKTFQKLLLILFFSISIIELFHPFFKEDNLKTIQSRISKNALPVYHTSAITYYPMKYYSNGLNNNYLLFKNPLNETTVNLIGGKGEEIDSNLNNFVLIDSKAFTNRADMSRVFNYHTIVYSINLIFENKNLSVYTFVKR